jgi:hypothetical protein
VRIWKKLIGGVIPNGDAATALEQTT